MKNIAPIIAWTFITTVIVLVVFNPTHGVLFQSPASAIGLGLIGLGMCMEAKKKMATKAQVEVDRKPRR